MRAHCHCRQRSLLMPQFRKEALSKYIGTGCRRQLRLYLSPDIQRYEAERTAQRMPPVQPPRPGLRQIMEVGEQWGLAKVADLAQAFGSEAIIGTPHRRADGQTHYQPIP